MAPTQEISGPQKDHWSAEQTGAGYWMWRWEFTGSFIPHVGSVLGIDPSSSMISSAKEDYGSPKAEFRIVDWTYLLLHLYCQNLLNLLNLLLPLKND
ncbi:hypothetical protein ACJ73_04279 [Blastomyces percursus]|uniref:Uncharacterized protein n=1 Tax=Blastomyces percursus TaxID=1658174 RepID=A0A1J9R9N1_9EURO|nr:hypothetical protein ACJ73_04279 [Blastomyces percursus]